MIRIGHGILYVFPTQMDYESGLTEKMSMTFAIPIILREQGVYHSDCYLYQVNVAEFSEKNMHSIVYANFDSALRSIPHDETIPIPVVPQYGIYSLEYEKHY